MKGIRAQSRPARRLAEAATDRTSRPLAAADGQTPSLRRSRSKTNSAPSTHLAAIADLDLVDLRARWHDAFGIEPLTRLSREVVVAALSYHAQEQMSGGLAKKVERRLETLAAELAATGAVKVAAEDALRPGTRLVREWNGVVHEVIVLDTHFLWKEQPYASLSEIARAITGARWSGPRFFGTATKPRRGTAGEGAQR